MFFELPYGKLRALSVVGHSEMFSLLPLQNLCAGLISPAPSFSLTRSMNCGLCFFGLDLLKRSLSAFLPLPLRGYELLLGKLSAGRFRADLRLCFSLTRDATAKGGKALHHMRVWYARLGNFKQGKA